MAIKSAWTSCALGLVFASMAACAGPQAESHAGGVQADQAVPPQRIAEQTLRNPLDRMMMRERMRVQILNRTDGFSVERYQAVRPELGRQLAALGLPAADAAEVLVRVDETRLGGVTNAPLAHAR
jgi:hypothetical protein